MPREPEVARAAARWVVAKDRGLNPAESKALLDWLAADPRHAAEYGRMLQGWKGLEGLAAVPEMAAMADAVDIRSRTRRRRVWIVASGFFATAAALAAGLWIRPRVPFEAAPALAQAAERSYTVLPSTARQVQLPDGSVAELNGDSQIETDFAPAERRVRLLRGEANFIVAKNPKRPFIVSAGPVSVRAVGTAFNVRLSPGQVEVLVTEGKVRLTDTAEIAPSTKLGRLSSAITGHSLEANERAIVATAGPAVATVKVDKPTSAEFDEALAWKSTRLVFDHTPLDEVVAAFNRYNRDQLVLADPTLRVRTLTGVFRTDNLSGFIRLLPASVDVIAETAPDGQTFLHAAP